MLKKLRIFLLLIMPVFTFYAFDVAAGWMKWGSKVKSYEMGIDKGAGRDGKNCASIKSIDKKIDGFGTLMQNFKPSKYLGKKIQMTGYVKSEGVNGWAGLWLRVDRSGEKSPLAFDNMNDRPIKGNTGWSKYEIVLEVPDSATNIAFGALLHGTGQIWFDDINFDIAPDSVPVTNPGTEPKNLHFED